MTCAWHFQAGSPYKSRIRKCIFSRNLKSRRGKTLPSIFWSILHTWLCRQPGFGTWLPHRVCLCIFTGAWVFPPQTITVLTGHLISAGFPGTDWRATWWRVRGRGAIWRGPLELERLRVEGWLVLPHDNQTSAGTTPSYALSLKTKWWANSKPTLSVNAALGTLTSAHLKNIL